MHAAESSVQIPRLTVADIFVKHQRLILRKHADGVYTVTANADAGYSQWQGQFHIESSNVIAEGKEYDIRVVLTPDVDITGATVKVVEVGGDDHDNIFLTQDRHDIYALEDNVIEIVKVAEAGGNALNPVKFTFDFAGLPAGKLSLIHI